MNANRPLLRDAVGFFAGGFLAGVASGLAFIAFFSLPSPKPTDHTREALAILVLVSFFCGGIIGRRAFSIDFLSQLLPSVIGSYIVMTFLCILASLDLSEAATIIGLASVGIVCAAVLMLLLRRRFPPKAETHEPDGLRSKSSA